MTDGFAFEVRMRKASNMDDLPVLLRPVIRLTRPNPLTEKFRNARNPETVSSEIIGFIADLQLEYVKFCQEQWFCMALDLLALSLKKQLKLEFYLTD